MSNVWNKSQGLGMCLSFFFFNVSHGHGNVVNSCCGSVFPPGKQRLDSFSSVFSSARGGDGQQGSPCTGRGKDQ